MSHQKTIGSKRRYIIHETNFRDKEGNQLAVDRPENVFEETSSLSYKGSAWWHNCGHVEGAEPKQEAEFDVEFDSVVLTDGTRYDGGLMDVLYTSYQPTVIK